MLKIGANLEPLFLKFSQHLLKVFDRNTHLINDCEETSKFGLVPRKSFQLVYKVITSLCCK